MGRSIQGGKKGTLHSEKLLLPMLITILVIIGFQCYWLYDNYNREKRILTIKTNSDFRESIFELQAGKFNTRGNFKDSLTKDSAIVKIFVTDNHETEPGDQPDVDAVEMINVLGNNEGGEMRRDTNGKRQQVLVSFNRSANWHGKDSLIRNRFPDGAPGEKFIRLLAGVDSLQDSLRIKEIEIKFQKKLKDDQAAVPFTILRLDSSTSKEKPPFNEVRLGFAKPVTYKLQLENTFPYLLNKLTWPLVFSIFIIAVTIVSFVLLYKNVLKQQRLVVMKNDFISNITHELKTPIATVGVAIEALRNFGAAQSPERTKEYLDISASELQRLGLLVDKVLKVSMLENNKLELKKENFDIRQLIEEVVSIMKLQLEKQNATVNIETLGERFVIEADRLHIISVVYNLIDNALKYSKENPKIDIVLTSLAEVIEIKIKDNGIGIPKEYRFKVFEKFFRVPSGDMHNVKGYGLGLSYVKEILMEHMGFITVESEPGKGSLFTIILPYKEAPVIHIGDKRRIIKKSVRL
jgi:two-component system, OmpR family, phosphate regulon sensor histidine kinase PhoR